MYDFERAAIEAEPELRAEVARLTVELEAARQEWPHIWKNGVWRIERSDSGGQATWLCGLRDDSYGQLHAVTAELEAAKKEIERQEQESSELRLWFLVMREAIGEFTSYVPVHCQGDDRCVLCEAFDQTRELAALEAAKEAGNDD